MFPSESPYIIYRGLSPERGWGQDIPWAVPGRGWGSGIRMTTIGKPNGNHLVPGAGMGFRRIRRYWDLASGNSPGGGGLRRGRSSWRWAWVRTSGDFQPRGRLSVSPGWVFLGLAVLGRRIGVAGLPLITGGPGRGENGLRNLQEDPSPECDPFCRSRVPSSFRSSGGRSPGHPGGRRRSSSPGPSPEFPPTGLC